MIGQNDTAEKHSQIMMLYMQQRQGHISQKRTRNEKNPFLDNAPFIVCIKI